MIRADEQVEPGAPQKGYGHREKQGSHRTGKSGKSQEFENKHSRSGKDLKFDLIRKNPGNNRENC